MNKLLKLMAIAAVVVGVGSTVLPVSDAHAVNVFSPCNGNQSAVCAGTNDNATSMVRSAINILLYALGIVAVIMIIIGGFRYTMSDGDSSNLKSAKDTILYSVVGLIVAILAFAIVNFVLGNFIK